MMTKEVEARVKIFQQAMIACHSSNPTDCIEWFADKIIELEKENKELKTVKIPQLERKIASIRGCHSVDAKKLNARTEQVERLKQEIAELKKKNDNLVASSKTIISLSDKIETRTMEQLTKAKGIILKLYNAGRDVLMCRAEEKAYDNLEEAINDRSIEQFLKEVSE